MATGREWASRSQRGAERLNSDAPNIGCGQVGSKNKLLRLAGLNKLLLDVVIVRGDRGKKEGQNAEDAD